MVKLLQYILSEGHPKLFWIHSNSKVCCFNLEADQVAFVLQVRAYLPVEIKHTIQHDGELFPEIFIALAQLDCWSHDGGRRCTRDALPVREVIGGLAVRCQRIIV